MIFPTLLMCSSEVLAVNFFLDPPDAWNLGMRLAPLCRTTGAQTQLMITLKAERWTSFQSQALFIRTKQPFVQITGVWRVYVYLFLFCYLNNFTLGCAQQDVNADGLVVLGQVDELAELDLSLGQRRTHVEDVQRRFHHLGSAGECPIIRQSNNLNK